VDLTGARAELPELVGVRQPGLIGRPAGLPGLTADAELRWAILRRLAATGRAGDAEIEAELARDATDAGARHAMACRAAVPDAGHKAMAWRLLAETDDLGVLAAVETSRGFLQPEQAALLAPYTERYFEALPGIWAMRGEHIRVQLSQLLFPHPASSPRLLERIDAFLAAERPDPGLTRVLTGSATSSRGRCAPARCPPARSRRRDPPAPVASAPITSP
jgi:aminopeptidase N